MAKPIGERRDYLRIWGKPNHQRYYCHEWFKAFLPQVENLLHATPHLRCAKLATTGGISSEVGEGVLLTSVFSVTTTYDHDSRTWTGVSTDLKKFLTHSLEGVVLTEHPRKSILEAKSLKRLLFTTNFGQL